MYKGDKNFTLNSEKKARFFSYSTHFIFPKQQNNLASLKHVSVVRPSSMTKAAHTTLSFVHLY